MAGLQIVDDTSTPALIFSHYSSTACLRSAGDSVCSAALRAFHNVRDAVRGVGDCEVEPCAMGAVIYTGISFDGTLPFPFPVLRYRFKKWTR